jgi:hypothetical protein
MVKRRKGRKGYKGPSSERVRQVYNWTWFKSLAVGEKFVFGSEVEGYGSKIGTCEKISVRKYKYTGTVHGGKEVEITAQVGSIEAIVIKLNKEGEPDKVGTYTPYLGD